MRALRGLIAIACMFIAAPVLAFHPEWLKASSVSSATVTGIATGDFNEDGRPDVVARTSQTVTLHLLNQDGTMASPGVIVQAGGDTGEPVAGDMNGDHHLDVVIGDNSAPPGAPDQTSIIVYPGNGDGTFGSPITTLLSFSPSQIRAGDFNKDGKPDLSILSYASARLAVYTGDGTGHFTESIHSSLGESATDMTVGDVDHDGNPDVVVAYENAKPFRIYFGRGDATFDRPADFVAPSPMTLRVLAADLDHDQDLELLFTDFDNCTLTVAVNTGSRTFATPVAYSTGPDPYDFGDPYDLVADDFDQDGNVDVLVLLINTKALATFLGNGNGTLRNPARLIVSDHDFPFVVAAADITGDSRPDLFVGSRYTVNVFENRAGDVSFRVQPAYPTITVGQTASFSVVTCPVYDPDSCYFPALTNGTITLKNNGTAIGSGVLSGGQATINVTSPLPVGIHSITAEFSGDSDYHAGVSGPVQQKVINERTTTTVYSNVPGPEVEYGQSWLLIGTVTSPLPDPLNGSFWLYTNDVRSQYTQSGPTTHWSLNPPPGTYHYYATFEGTATQPPSKSEVFTQVVRKGRPTASVSGLDVGRYGSTNPVYVEAHTSFTTSGITNVKLYEGSTLLGETGSWYSDWINVTLPVGVHYLQAVYEGNDNFEPARSPLFRFTVLPAGFVLDAYATGNTVRIAAWPTDNNSYVLLSRRVGNGAWQPATYMTQNPMTQTNLSPGVYSYRAEQHAYNTQQLIATSNIDVAIVGANFSDDPLVSGQPIRSTHISELLTATNTMLAAGGLPPVTIPDAGAGQPIRASHMNTLRDAINQARTALGMMSAQWTDTIAPGGALRAALIMELRDGLR
jgi:hypothetical protein